MIEECVTSILIIPALLIGIAFLFFFLKAMLLDVGHHDRR